MSDVINGLRGSDFMDRLMSVVEAIESGHVRIVPDPDRKANGKRLPVGDLSEYVAMGLSQTVARGIITDWPREIRELCSIGLSVEAVEHGGGKRKRRLAQSTVKVNRQIAGLVRCQLVDGQLVSDLIEARRSGRLHGS